MPSPMSYTAIAVPVFAAPELRQGREAHLPVPILSERRFFIEKSPYRFNLRGPGYALLQVLSRYAAPGSAWDRHPMSVAVVFETPSYEDARQLAQLAEWLDQRGDTLACDCLLAGRQLCELAARDDYAALDARARGGGVDAELAILGAVWWCGAHHLHSRLSQARATRAGRAQTDGR